MLSSTKSRTAGKLLLQTLFFFLMVTQICFAQWVQFGLEDKAIKEIAARNYNIFAVTTDSALYRSTDNGINWSQIVYSGAIDIAISQSGLLFMVLGYSQLAWENSLYRSSDNGNTWINLNIMEQISPPTGFIAGPSNVTVSPLGFVLCGLFRIESSGFGDSGTSLAMSTDDGSTWILPGWSTIGGEIFDFRGQSVITSGYFCMGSVDDCWTGVYLSSDNGQTWLYLGNPPYFVNDVLSMCLNGNILMGGWWPGLFLSDDSCQTWTQVSQIIPEVGLSIASGGMLVGSDNLGVFLFSDDGDSLGSFNEGLSNLNIYTFTTDNNGYVYVGTDNGVWRRPLSEIVPVELSSFTATVNGKEVILNWSTATELNNQGFEIERSEDNISFNKIGFVPGFGTTTEPKNYSYTDQSVNIGSYYYRLKQVDLDGSYEYSDVVEVDFRTFNSYLLEQNFPNPFNPTTTIKYSIPKAQKVRLTLFNLLGEEVTTLVNEEKLAGNYTVEFNATNVPSGVYFYQLIAGEFTSVKKMILIK